MMRNMMHYVMSPKIPVFTLDAFLFQSFKSMLALYLKHSELYATLKQPLDHFVLVFLITHIVNLFYYFYCTFLTECLVNIGLCAYILQHWTSLMIIVIVYGT